MPSSACFVSPLLNPTVHTASTKAVQHRLPPSRFLAPSLTRRLSPVLPTHPSFRPTIPITPATPISPPPRVRPHASATSTTSPVPAAARVIILQALSLSNVITLQRVVGAMLTGMNVTFPAPLATMLIVLFAISLLRLARLSKFVDRVSNVGFTPAVTLLTRWLPVFFVPNLVMLPLAPPLPAADLTKLVFLLPLAFMVTLLTTAAVCIGLRSTVRLVSGRTGGVIEPVSVKSVPPSNVLMSTLAAIATISFLLCVRATSAVGIPARFYAVATTLFSFCVAQRLPSRLKIILHPLISTTLATIGSIALLGAATGTPFATALAAYYVRSGAPLAGAGNLLAFLLGPAVVTFAFTVDRHRTLAVARAVEVSGSSMFAAIGSLFGTALVARALGLAPATRLLMVPRTITAPLAVPIAGMIGADVRLAASVVGLTGLLGANIARSVLSAVRVYDPVVRGLAVGASAHGLGTAAMSDEGSALPFAALAMTLVGVFSTLLVAFPPFRAVLLRAALGAAAIAAESS